MKFFKILFIVSVSIFILVLSLTVSNDFSQDLGRHLLLGKIIVATKTVPTTNLLSYTYANFPFINHHWLSEVVYYAMVTSLGIFSLQILKILLSILGLCGALYIGWRLHKNLFIVLLVSLLFLPAYFLRVNIRPEMFGYILFSSLLGILFLWYKQKWIYFAIPLILILWINLHSTWLFGYILAVLISIRKKSVVLFLISTIALLINPNGIHGLLFPLTVLTNYGYTISENMTVLFMIQYLGTRQYWYLALLLIVSAIGCGVLLYKRRYFEAMTLAIFTVGTFFQNRHSAFLCLTAIAVLPQLARPQWEKYLAKPAFLFFLSLFLLLISVSVVSNSFYEFLGADKKFGIEVKNQYYDFGEWAKTNLQNKKIFNTFDIGGYLAYAMYPQNKVFVDNRPEAYPAKSFQEEYIALQSDSQIREKQFKKWRINTVVMNHTDGTGWGKTFLSEMNHDKEWEITYLDGYAIVFEKRKKTADSMLENAINRTENKVELMNLYVLSRLINNKDMQNASYQKIANNFKNSCEYARVTRFDLSQNTDLFSQEKERTISSSYWWCF